MLLDTSIARMTVPALRPTGSAAAGPATATASSTTPPTESHSPSWLLRRPAPRPPPRRGQRTGAGQRARHRRSAQRRPEAKDEQRRVDEAHRRLRWVSVMTFQQRLDEVAAGVDPVQRHPGPAHARPKSGLARSSTPSRNRARNHGSAESTRSCSPVSASSTTIRPTSGSASSARSTTRNATTSFRCASRIERTLPLARADEVRDHHDQAAPRQRRDSIEHRGEVRGGRCPGVGCAVEFPSDAQRVAASGAGRDDAGGAGVGAYRGSLRSRGSVVEDGADPVAVSAEHPGQDEGELGKHVLLPAARAADHHGRRSVEDQPAGEVAVLVELAYLRFVEPGGDIPVDVPGVVALLVGRIPAKSSPLPRRGAIAALDAPVEPADDPPLQPVQQAVGRGHLVGVRGRPG